MQIRLAHNYGQWLASGGYLVLVMVGGEVDSAVGWRVIAGLIALLALFAWQAALRRSRAVADTPTSNIASAAQGYVELSGNGVPLEGQPLVAPLTSLPCLWFRYRVERRQGDKWVTESSGESTDSFLIDDGTGVCLVHPEGAEILPRGTDTWRRGDYRYTQSLIVKGEAVYVLGGFRTLGADSLNLDLHGDVKSLIGEWKADMPGLLKRFDLNGDGELDLKEWELARAQARREVQAEHRALRSVADTHTMGRPEDGRLFLISTLAPEKIEQRYRWWSLGHVVVFIAALSGLGFLWPR